MKKPANLIYGVNEKPPLFETIILGFQHISIFFIAISFPLLFGMNGFVGVVEVLFSRVMQKLRFLFPS